MLYTEYVEEAVDLLKNLIAIPSISRCEECATDVMEKYIHKAGMHCFREKNNVWAISRRFDQNRPTLLLNAHIDTVKPTPAWTRDPFAPTLEGDCLFGLGSNDCGGGLVSLLMAFKIMEFTCESYNLIYLASAEEEVSGENGVARVIPLLPKIDVAIVGEPTEMQPAIAEKGLMVIDGVMQGHAGHVAMSNGLNAIYEVLDDLLWLRDCRFDRISDLLGAVKVSVTIINAGEQHNIVPSECRFVIDVRSNELYTNEEIFDIIRQNVRSKLCARSFRLAPSHIDRSHPLVQKTISLGKVPFGSPTLSDQALMPFPSFKLGPGSSLRSHSADEFIRINEISDAIETYIQLLS